MSNLLWPLIAFVSGLSITWLMATITLLDDAQDGRRLNSEIAAAVSECEKELPRTQHCVPVIAAKRSEK